MKSILLMRHAKSSWDNPALSDFERPLAKRGFRTAPQMGQLIEALPCPPNVILCSTAVRARQTARLVIEQLSMDPRLHMDDSLYAADPQEILSAIQNVDEGFDSVLVIAHNPELEELASLLDAEFRDRLPTAALVIIECDTDYWREISTGGGETKEVFLPRQLFPDL